MLSCGNLENNSCCIINNQTQNANTTSQAESPSTQENYIKSLYNNIIGKDLKFNSPYGEINVIYSDYTASGRGLKQIEDFISTQVLPFYANVHSSCGFLSEQSENFRTESKAIVRRYLNTDEKDSIIFTGQGTTSCVNKLIKLMNLPEYVNFYQSLKKLREISDKFLNKGITDLFFELNSSLIEEVILKYHQLFKISNFCYSNRWGSFDCVLCRMTFLQESQYNLHETQDVHLKNLEKCASFNNSIFKPNFELKVNNLNIDDLIENYENFEPIVFLSILEHNSNALPWRETGAKIVYITGNININNSENNSKNISSSCSDFYKNLDEELKSFSKNFIKMGSFTAASNITGEFLDVDQISLSMHKNNSLAFFDYATASPYVKIDMNKPLPDDYKKQLGFIKKFTSEEEGLIYKDSVFFSPHKFLGGPNTPGVLIIKQHVVRNLLIPSEPGGGVVLFVRKERQNYVKNIEAREESGTPDIIGSVRIGMSLLIREKINDEFLLKLDEKLNTYVLNKLSKIKNLHILGNCVNTRRIPIYSLVIKFNGKLLHPNFVSALLNDLFGIQSRPGCSCASTYGQQCLGLEESYIESLEKLVLSGMEIFRPGYTRINFPYFYPLFITDYIISAIEFVSNYGWLFLPHYAVKIESGKYYHRKDDEEKRKWLNEVNLENGKIVLPNLIPISENQSLTKQDLEGYLERANKILLDIKNITKHFIGKSKLNLKILFSDYESERWFLISDDVEEILYKIDFDDILKKSNEDLMNQAKEVALNIKFNLKGNNRNNDNEDFNESEKNKNNDNQVIKYLQKLQIESEKDFPSKDNNTTTSELELNEISISDAKLSNKLIKDPVLFPEIPKKIIKLVGEASKDFNMLRDGDKILVGMSGGKDSTSLLHILLYFQKKVPFKIEIAGVTVDPQSSDYDPSPLIDYMKKLGVKYFFERDPILERAKTSLQKDSICAFCARMKRGIIYNCARREGYNVIALGQHLDDLAESFLMSAFHNGLLRTMKANYVIDQGDLRVIRPLVYCREKLLKEFVLKYNVPVIQENCPACFSAPKERHRVKVLLAQQENMFPSLFSSLQKAMIPLMRGLIESGKKDDLEI